jgi:hypothetical protein
MSNTRAQMTDVSIHAQELLDRYYNGDRNEFWRALSETDITCWCTLQDCVQIQDRWHEELADALCTVVPCIFLSAGTRLGHKNPGAWAMIRRVRRGQLNGPAWLYSLISEVGDQRWAHGKRTIYMSALRFASPTFDLRRSDSEKLLGEILFIANRRQLKGTGLRTCLRFFPASRGKIQSMVSDDAQRVDLREFSEKFNYDQDIKFFEHSKGRQVRYAKRFPCLLERILNNVSPHFPARVIASLVTRRIVWP